MKTYLVRYTKIPTNYNSQQSAVVEASSADDARKLVRRRLGDDRLELSNYDVAWGVEYEPENIEGKIISMNYK